MIYIRYNFFFFNDTATTEIYTVSDTLSLHDALPICLIYVILLFATPQWRRLMPTSWNIFPSAWQAVVAYFHFRLPPEGNPFNAIQQLTYCFIIFILSPFQIITGIMMSPALCARFPRFPG